MEIGTRSGVCTVAVSKSDYVVLYLLGLICWKNLKQSEECELVLQYYAHSLMRHSDEHSEDQNPDRNTDREDQTQDVIQTHLELDERPFKLHSGKECTHNFLIFRKSEED